MVSATATHDSRLRSTWAVLVDIILLGTRPARSTADRARLTAAEQAWIKFRDADVNFYTRYYVNSKGGLFLKTKLTEDRAAYLQSLVQNLPQHQGNDLGPI